jgi:hypothetical protein
MLQKWEEKVEKKEAEKRSKIMPETIGSISLEPIPTPPNILYNNVGRVGIEIEARQEVIAEGENVIALDPQAHQECLQFIRTALTTNDPETACDVASVLKEVCSSGYADREAIWRDLVEFERQQFRSLVAGEPLETEQPTICLRSAPPIADSDNPQQPESPQPAPELELIASADAEALREIATLWWPEYYPEQVQVLITQMFGWNAPGTRYDAATITAWLIGEDVVVRKRITELVQQRSEGA